MKGKVKLLICKKTHQIFVLTSLQVELDDSEPFSDCISTSLIFKLSIIVGEDAPVVAGDSEPKVAAVDEAF